jgi:hypothetical protein
MPDEIWVTKNEHPAWMSPLVIAVVVIALLILFTLFSPSSFLGPETASHKEAVHLTISTAELWL